MSFRWKLFISYLALCMIMAVGLFTAVSSILETHLLDVSRENLLHQAQLAKQLVEQQHTLKPQQLAHKLGAGIKARVTLIALDGRVVGDSDVRDDQVLGLENHRNRPEVQQA